MNKRFFLILFTTCIALSGCTKPKWWIGTWTFDPQMTKTHAPSEKNEGMNEMIYNLAAPALLSAFDGMQMTITPNEVITMKNGSGKAVAYTIVERPTENSVVMRIGDNVSTYTLEGDYLIGVTTGDVQIKACFKRVE